MYGRSISSPVPVHYSTTVSQHGSSTSAGFFVPVSSEYIYFFLHLYCSHDYRIRIVSSLQGQLFFINQEICFCKKKLLEKWFTVQYVQRCDKIPGPPAQIPLFGSFTEMFVKPHSNYYIESIFVFTRVRYQKSFLFQKLCRMFFTCIKNGTKNHLYESGSVHYQVTCHKHII